MEKQELKAKLPLTLIVGLGGTGCDIIRRVSELANDAQKEFIRFVAFDTDANELRELRHAVNGLFTVQTSKRMTVGQALDTNDEARENWFPVNPQLYNKPLTEGAGQIRAISRLAFDSCLREGRVAELHTAIDELQRLNSDDMEQSMRVVIVTTLVGGTGSGILLPVSMYIRHYLENHCRKKPIIRGVCLLPDVFFKDPSKSEQEKEDLKANAYATLRELNAFIMRADAGKDSELYKRYSLKMPREGTTDEFDMFDEKPMDFCFLFDGQNFDGDGLANLTQYKEHAAECIYASSISILNKRLNSSEDNTILQRCAEEGRNCYCGIGSAKMVYPFKDVRDYVTYKWMEQAMSKDWLFYDKKIQEERKTQSDRGNLQSNGSKGEMYVGFVDSTANKDNAFSKAIQNECIFKAESTQMSDRNKWELYVDALDDYTKMLANDFEKNSGREGGVVSANALRDAINQMRDAVQENEFEEVASIFRNLETRLRDYFEMAKRAAAATARFEASSLFSVEDVNSEEVSKHRIEYWLMNNAEPMHPNAIRYFLYKLQQHLKLQLKRLQHSSGATNDSGQKIESKEDVTRKINEFFTGGVASKGIDEKEERLVDFVGKNGGRGEKVTKSRRRTELEGVCDDCEAYLEDVKKYYGMSLKEEIFQTAIKFIADLSKSYETFYDELEHEIKNFSKIEHQIETAYADSKDSPTAGSPTKYVCASKPCLQAVVNECQNHIGSFTLTPEFRWKLFNGKDRTQTDETVKPCGIFNSSIVPEKDRSKKMRELAANDMLNFWRGALLEQYGPRIDIDIIDALFKEAEILGNLSDFIDQKAYIDTKKREMLKLSAPFIDKPMGNEPRIIQAIGISKEVVDAEGVQKARVLNEVFPEKDIDPFIDKYQLLCLKAVYNLKLTDLAKFSAGSDEVNNPYAEGSYCRAYKLRVDQILPNSAKTRRLTPHIDKNWHYLGVLPELDEKTEHKSVTEAHKAFFACFVKGLACVDDSKKYYFIGKDGRRLSDEIVVRDGRCNRLCEVYEAMCMSRPLTLEFIQRYDKELADERTLGGMSGKDFRLSQNYKAMVQNLTFSRCWPGTPKEKDFKISVFELPILFKITTGDSSFKNSAAEDMMMNFVKFMNEYLDAFYAGDVARRNMYLMDWIKEQAFLMLDNLASKYDFGSYSQDTIMCDPLNDMLIIDMIGMLVSWIRKPAFVEQCDVADEIQQKYNALCEEKKAEKDAKMSA